MVDPQAVIEKLKVVRESQDEQDREDNDEGCSDWVERGGSNGSVLSREYVSVPLDEADSANIGTGTPSKTEIHQPLRVSFFRILLLCVANFGIGASWALEFAIVTPYFEKGLQAGSIVSHAVWVVGPLSGLIVAPMVGSASDRCTSGYGRRRPFILGGMVGTLMGLVLFSNAVELTEVFVSRDSEAFRGVSICIAIVAFCILDLAINTTMWPIRALQGDLIPESQQHTVQSVSFVIQSLGDLCVNGVLHMFEQPIVHIRFIFAVMAAFYTVTASVLLIAGKEVALRNDDVSSNCRGEQGCRVPNLIGYLQDLPGWMWKIGMTYALGCFMIFCTMPNSSSWLGSVVLGGNADAEKGSREADLYEEGVSLYGRAGLIRGFVQMLIAGMYPRLMSSGYMKGGTMIGTSFLIYSLSIVVLSDTRVRGLGEMVVVLMGLPCAVLFTIPVGLVVAKSDEWNRGRMLGALNCFAVVPQLIDTAYTGVVSKVFGEAAVMLIGAAWGVLTCVCALLLLKDV